MKIVYFDKKILRNYEKEDCYHYIYKKNHGIPANGSYSTLCGLDGFDDENLIKFKEGKITCPDCLVIIKVVKDNYLI